MKKIFLFIMVASLFIGCKKIELNSDDNEIAEVETIISETDITEVENNDAIEIENDIEDEDEIMDFYICEIDDEIFSRIKGLSFKDDCTLPREDLRYLHVLYVDFNNDVQNGEIIVNKYIADDVLEIFRKLYEAGYQIESIKLVDEFGADDETSMAANNSSAFNFRFISYTTKVSKHGLGMAIDINPLYNPYIKEVEGRLNVEPANALDYVDREKEFPHKIDENDLAYQLFIEAGFEWGGAWSSSKDYQHFEWPTSKIKDYYQ